MNISPEKKEKFGEALKRMLVLSSSDPQVHAFLVSFHLLGPSELLLSELKSCMQKDGVKEEKILEILILWINQYWIDSDDNGSLDEISQILDNSKLMKDNRLKKILAHAISEKVASNHLNFLAANPGIEHSGSCSA
jgi:hypothetical protein